VIELSTSNTIKLNESESAITFNKAAGATGAFESVTIACRRPAEGDEALQ
jgi:hypothetical protein